MSSISLYDLIAIHLAALHGTRSICACVMMTFEHRVGGFGTVAGEELVVVDHVGHDGVGQELGTGWRS